MTSNRRGFSLLELLLVVMIIGMSMLIAMPRLADARQRLNLDSASQLLARDLAYARSSAIKLNRPIALRRISATSYGIDTLLVRNLDAGVTLAVASPDSAQFAPFGPVLLGSGTFQLAAGSKTKSIQLYNSGMTAVR